MSSPSPAVFVVCDKTTPARFRCRRLHLKGYTGPHPGTPDMAPIPSVVYFEAQSRGPRTRCPSFAARVTPAPRKTRFRLVASFTRRDLHPQGPSSGFCLHRFLLTQALPGARRLHLSGLFSVQPLHGSWRASARTLRMGAFSSWSLTVPAVKQGPVRELCRRPTLPEGN